MTPPETTTAPSAEAPAIAIMHLQCRIRRLERLCLLAWGVLLVVCVAAWKPPDGVLESGELRMHDENGRERIVLSCRNTEPSLALIDSSGVRRAHMKCDTEGAPSLRLSDAAGNERLILNCSDSGYNLASLAADGHVRTSIGISGNGLGYAAVYDNESRCRVSIAERPDGYGLQLTDATRATDVRLSLAAGGGLCIERVRGEPTWSLTISADRTGEAALSVSRAGKRASVIIGVDEQGAPILRLLDSANQRCWTWK